MVEEKALAIPETYSEIASMAKAFVASGMFTDTKQMSQAIVKIQAGRELGLPPVYSMQNINMIRNRLTTSANTMAMLVKKSGHYNYRIKEHTDLACEITFQELDGGKWVEVGTSRFTIDDAKRAELVRPDSGWVKYPRAMLFSRAISQGARLYAPDAISGVYTDEEIRSIPPRPEEDTVASEVTKPDTAQPEKDVEGMFPPDPPHAAEATKAAEVVEEQQEITPETEPAPESIVNLEWLEESLKTLTDKGHTAYSEESLLTYMRLSYKGVEGDTVAEIASKLDKGMAKHFTKVIQDALDKA